MNSFSHMVLYHSGRWGHRPEDPVLGNTDKGDLVGGDSDKGDGRDNKEVWRSL
ncbi:MAG: hypothetical protein KTQ13_00515 [Ferruginibacter sp.]|nr:hypothetical protein [Chitinophagaceae bacterium]MBP6286026.1 hypothetical protein [Ferruginibacter sp.]MBU9935103.1 hypothetical protein [Ferruginibacter sp.]